MRYPDVFVISVLAFALQKVSAFVASPAAFHTGGSSPSSLAAAGQGFGKPSGAAPRKTYGSESQVGRDVIDVESAMNSFFSSRDDWMPLFRTMAIHESCQAFDFLGGSIEEPPLQFDEGTSLWKKLEAIPQQEDDRSVLANFLDEAQKSLVEIPVDETTEDDELDLQFVEEGRRFLALNRFHVLRGNRAGCMESFESLFATCWSELLHLHLEQEEHTGSLILLPNYELSDLRRFTDMNLVQPLEWLGLKSDFEVSAFERGSPAIRLVSQ